MENFTKVALIPKHDRRCGDFFLFFFFLFFDNDDVLSLIIPLLFFFFLSNTADSVPCTFK